MAMNVSKKLTFPYSGLMEALCSSKTLVPSTCSTWHYSPQDWHSASTHLCHPDRWRWGREAGGGHQLMHCSCLEPQQYPGVLLWRHILCLHWQAHRTQVIICTYEIQVFLENKTSHTRKCCNTINTSARTHLQYSYQGFTLLILW
jgi:hypothetical protein